MKKMTAIGMTPETDDGNVFCSILYPTGSLPINLNSHEPDYFNDLNLDQIVNSIIENRKSDNLNSFYFSPCQDLKTIEYRQEIMKDLGSPDVLEKIRLFSRHIQTVVSVMKSVGESLTIPKSWDCNYLQKSRFMESVDTYCSSINELGSVLSDLQIRSAGLTQFRNYVLEYEKSEKFVDLLHAIKNLQSDFSKVTYSMLIQSNSIKIRKFEQEIDHTKEIESIFSKFRQSEENSISKKVSTYDLADHVDVGILDLVSRIYPVEFKNLDAFCDRYSECFDLKIINFAAEVQFYLAYCEYIEFFKFSELRFCFPTFKPDSKKVYCYDSFDLALASVLSKRNESLVTNSFSLNNEERIVIVTGPNQGGKTTFARMFGQIHHLASLGLPVPGTKAQLILFDHIFTHFDQVENWNRSTFVESQC